MNFGALAITNALVYKEEPETKVYEFNPVTAQIHGYEQHPSIAEEPSIDKWVSFMKIFMSQTIPWFIIVGGYLYVRLNIISETSFYGLALLIFFMLINVGLDFINDLGFLAGKFIWG